MRISAESRVLFSFETPSVPAVPSVPFTPKLLVTSTNSKVPDPLVSEQLRSLNFPPVFVKQTKYTGVMANADADANAPTASIATTLIRINLNRVIDELLLSAPATAGQLWFCRGDAHAARATLRSSIYAFNEAPTEPIQGCHPPCTTCGRPSSPISHEDPEALGNADNPQYWWAFSRERRGKKSETVGRNLAPPAANPPQPPQPRLKV
jgi:hypothetical protein